jgi:hypothetical protein
MFERVAVLFVVIAEALGLTGRAAYGQELVPLSRHSEIRFDSNGLGFDNGHPNVLIVESDPVATFDRAFRGQTSNVEPGGALNSASWDVSQVSTITPDLITAELQQFASTATDRGSPGIFQDTRFILDFVVSLPTVAALQGVVVTEPAGSDSWARIMLLRNGVAIFNSDLASLPFVADLEPGVTYELAIDVFGGAMFDAITFTSAEATLGIVGDADGDGILDHEDNCTLVANADQRDTNGDGFGNVCDPDLDDNGLVNRADIRLLRDALFTADADADFNGDGIVDLIDVGIARGFLFQAPGPSGLLP